jgi:hypothetical protein
MRYTIHFLCKQIRKYHKKRNILNILFTEKCKSRPSNVDLVDFICTTFYAMAMLSFVVTVKTVKKRYNFEH